MADATLLLAACKTALAAALPGVPVRTSKRRATGRQFEGGYQAGLPVPCLVLSCEDDHAAALGTFESLAMGYRVSVDYVKSAQEKVTGAADAGAAAVVDDPDVRDKREAIRAALFKTIAAAVPGATDARFRTLPGYEAAGEAKALLLVSGLEFTFTKWVPRT